MNIKLELFNLRNKLTVDQLVEANICQKHLQEFDNFSEKEIYFSLRENLSPYSFNKEIKMFLESTKDEIESKPLVYDLKSLYKIIERKNHGELYRQPLSTLLDIINRDTDESRMEGILNELSIYDWVPEIKNFLISLSKNPFEIQNLSGNGKAQKVFSIVEKCEEGTLAFISDRWFLISDNEIKQVIYENYIQDEEKVREARILEQVMLSAEIEDDMIYFNIDEGLSIGISTKKNGEIYFNGEKQDGESTLESIFNSPIIPYLQRDKYLLCETTKNNIDKFVDLDIALKVVNPVYPFLEKYCFNFKDKIYLYNKDARRGSSFYQYENAIQLIQDVQKELDYDLSKFYENKLSDELKKLKNLEEKEKNVELKLEDVNASIELLNDEVELLKESEELKKVMNDLVSQKYILTKELNSIKEDKIQTRKSILHG